MSDATLSDVPQARRDVLDTPLRRRARLRLLRPLLMLGGIAAVAMGSLTWWLQGGRIVSVDNAYVRAAKLAVATDVSGLVQEVTVREGSLVREGEVLFRLDPRQFRIALDGAQANLAQVALQMEAAKRDYQRMLRDIAAKQAQVQSDQASFDRYASLVQTAAVARAQYDDARFRLAADKAALESLQVQAQVQLAKLGGSADIEVERTPEYLRALSQVDEARRQLDHTIVRAPFAAIATQVEQVQPGMYLTAATAAFGLVSTERLWVEANPKETELTHVKPGDPVQVTVDTYPGRVWQGRVESIAPNSGSEFSILPAQNASGNWVKVVQRIPVRVQVERRPGDPPLRAGMSVEVAIDTGHLRHLADLIP
ncbi:Membrane fusion component of tripartite multidrug resistance system [Rhodovastum atsumiense]|uniref:HlyD family secretion protein n=1 Tax=Rhodovastum atsumiense TaxID=504468 RepID=A0A5M6IZG1_9PROT|nr:HlyD family secretion protein [Rhodovastum atsumiense]KAA5613683.1 HlyD family secretion protein [Rhodovastum atsumiense]CAH2599598.1 Membrane fusion component of tripartite multidrug resistance system [Rhodovastum atsumiense]